MGDSLFTWLARLPKFLRWTAIPWRDGKGLVVCLVLTFICGVAWPPRNGVAATPQVSVVDFAPGKTPFISRVKLHMDETAQLAQVQFRVTPKPGSITRAVSARYSRRYLSKRGFLQVATGDFTVPVFGLYQDYANRVDLVFTFVDGSSQKTQLALPSAAYSSGIYDHPAAVVQARTNDSSLSYDFMMLKSFINPHSPTIVDTDGEIRWVGTSDTGSMPAIFLDNSFFVMADSVPGIFGTGTRILRNEFDGTVTTVKDYAADNVTTFHHNFDYGKVGILVGVTTPEYLESTVMEVNTFGKILQTWNMGRIISAAMRAGGDDPTQFVAAAGSGVDWFHNNSNTYRASDDSVVISSRENFVIALDYETHAIKWIIGDPTKQWHEFPSLAKYELTATSGTEYPIGQHSVSFYRDKLLLFDNGYNSADHSPKGEFRTYSAPRKYSVDQAAGTFTEVWDYLPASSVFSPITSSVYEDGLGDYLIDYSTVGPYLFAELIGLSPGRVKAFDYKYKEVSQAATAWNAVPIHLENLVFD